MAASFRPPRAPQKRRLAPAAITALLTTSACLNFGGIDLAPTYAGEHLVVPATWRGESPFVEASGEGAPVSADWWTRFGDPVLDGLIDRAMAESPDLFAAAERFLQARDEMMKARSAFMPHVDGGVGINLDRQSEDALFRAPTSPITDSELSLGGAASWELDFFSRLRNRTRARIHEAQEVAALYGAVRLSLQAELATAYFTLRGLDAQNAIYRQSIAYYEQSLELATLKFKGLIAAELDVARAKYLLSSSQARQLGIQAQRQVTEHAIAVLVNAVPATFSVAPQELQAPVILRLPAILPSTLLERRPDIASMERRMAQANRHVGVARAAFFPSVPLGAEGGIAGHVAHAFRVPNFFWSLGAFLRLPVFDGGARRAELQRAWSVWRETEHRYRRTVLSAFREVEDGLSLTRLREQELVRQEEAVAAASRQQTLSMDLYRGGLASSLELINAQVNTLESRLKAAELRASLQRSVVGLVRACGGGWSHGDLPADDDVQPFGVMQVTSLAHPEPSAHIDLDSQSEASLRDLARPASF